MRSRGFTLLEVMITVAILATMTLAVSIMLRNGFEIRTLLAKDDEVSHRLSATIEKVARDVQHAFIVSSKDQSRNAIGRATKTLFRIEKGFDSDKLYLTTFTRQRTIANSNESDQTYVVYQLMDDKKDSSRKNLYRGEAPFIPDDFKNTPPMKLLARHIKSFQVRAWKGDDWLKDRWDSTRSDTRDKLPHLVEIEIEAWDEDPFAVEKDSSKKEVTVKMKTVVYIERSVEQQDLKQPMSSIKWY